MLKADSRKQAVSGTLKDLGDVSARGRFLVKNHQPKELSEQTQEYSDKPEDSSRQPLTPIKKQTRAVEYGGQKGPEPTRYGDWEKAGRCTDF